MRALFAYLLFGLFIVLGVYALGNGIGSAAELRDTISEAKQAQFNSFEESI